MREEGEEREMDVRAFGSGIGVESEPGRNEDVSVNGSI